MITVILLIVALVLFIIAALPVASVRFNLVAAGLAFVTGALLTGHFGL